eukprot:Rhum_TRINITY_DN14281_c6_g1::Rhum_TRINITY_DN14281_c6_g1_i1::g.76855::m.76855
MRDSASVLPHLCAVQPPDRRGSYFSGRRCGCRPAAGHGVAHEPLRRPALRAGDLVLRVRDVGVVQLLPRACLLRSVAGVEQRRVGGVAHPQLREGAEAGLRARAAGVRQGVQLLLLPHPLYRHVFDEVHAALLWHRQQAAFLLVLLGLLLRRVLIRDLHEELGDALQAQRVQQRLHVVEALAVVVADARDPPLRQPVAVRSLAVDDLADLDVVVVARGEVDAQRLARVEQLDEAVVPSVPVLHRVVQRFPQLLVERRQLRSRRLLEVAAPHLALLLEEAECLQLARREEVGLFLHAVRLQLLHPHLVQAERLALLRRRAVRHRPDAVAPLLRHSALQLPGELGGVAVHPVVARLCRRRLLVLLLIGRAETLGLLLLLLL